MTGSTTSAPLSPTFDPLPSVWSRAAGPAALTLAITLTRVYGELHHLPLLIAGSGAGGNFSLLGISWLPPLLGWWFARSIVGRSEQPKKALAKTLIAYGFLARIPVVVLTWIAIEKGDAWDTHLTKFGPDPAKYPTTLSGKLLGTVVAQLGFWIFAWTLGTGMLVGWLWMRKQRTDRAAPAPSR